MDDSEDADLVDMEEEEDTDEDFVFEKTSPLPSGESRVCVLPPEHPSESILAKKSEGIHTPGAEAEPHGASSGGSKQEEAKTSEMVGVAPALSSPGDLAEFVSPWKYRVFNQEILLWYHERTPSEVHFHLVDQSTIQITKTLWPPLSKSDPELQARQIAALRHILPGLEYQAPPPVVKKTWNIPLGCSAMLDSVYWFWDEFFYGVVVERDDQALYTFHQPRQIPLGPLLKRK
eukprot:TRINITY_DN8964_c0_g1_i2.p1 TRINITY_DN8964_c0_g1~~TRINITY_DN8964_c0_g1_i2.p1  ORF type:complete len:270 (-),score=46.74 TRINITY_DN8964_c0_g1_i2:86-781(-)